VRDGKAETEILSALRSALGGNPRYGTVNSIVVMDAGNGTIYAKLHTSLYDKPSNEPPGVGICASIIGSQYNGKKLDSVEVFASSGARLAKSLSGNNSSLYCAKNSNL
jgi:hypothetical protein